MAPQLSLVRLEDLAADIDSLDLLSGGFTPRMWEQAIANEGDASVSEVITLKVVGSSQDNLASLVQSLDSKIRQANRRKDFSERYDVWLRAKMGEETNARQRMILKAKPSPTALLFDVAAGRDRIARDYQLGLECTPWWEDPFPYPSTTAKNGIGSIGGLATLSETIQGDVNARLVKATIESVAANHFYKIWMGWKTGRFGNKANFVSVWPVRLGALGNDTSSTVDATAYDGNRITVTFAIVPGLAQRSLVTVSDITANHADQRGMYTVLMRAKMSDTSVARTRIGFGYSDGTSGMTQANYRSRQVISGTNWLFYEMGDVSIPPSDIFSTYTLQDCAISVDAERVSGTGNLHVDCFVLIPVDDASIKVIIEPSASFGNPGTFAHIFQRADGRIESFAAATSPATAAVKDLGLVSPRNWSLPANDESPVLVLTGQQLTLSDKADTANFTYSYIPRWLTLRGSET